MRIAGCLSQTVLIVPGGYGILSVSSMNKSRRDFNEGALKPRGPEAATGRLRRQSLRAELMARLGAISAQIVHDSRQPLASIVANAQAALRMLEQGPCDPGEIREILNDIVLEGDRAAEILGRINKMVQRRELRREEIPLAATIQEALDLLQDEIEEHGIEVRFSKDMDCNVHANPAQIRQVMIDLIMNSLEAMQVEPETQRRLELKMAPAAEGMEQITVSDSGPGIAEADIPRLWDPFWTTKDQALGIGLFLCRSIIQAYGGRLWCQNNREGGTSFCFTLPLSAKPGPDQKASMPVLADGTARHQSTDTRSTLRVLLVDDSEPYRSTTWSMLANLSNMELAGEAIDGLGAVQKAEQLKPDLILMDVRLEGINGIEAAARIRKVAPDSKILFLSQYDDPDVVRAVLHTGAFGYVLKADSARDLLPALKAISQGEVFLSSSFRDCL